MDQASKLRSAVIKKSDFEKSFNDSESLTRVICVTSGKGGVGKTNFTLNLALALRENDKKVVIIDADLGLANIEILLGIKPKYGLLDLIKEEVDIEDIVSNGPSGIKIISGGSGIAQLANVSLSGINKILNGIYELKDKADYILIDTGAGISDSIFTFIKASQEIIVVTNPEPTSIADAYAMIKRISMESKDKDINLIVNRAESSEEASGTFKRLKLVGEKFLNLQINYLGYILNDRSVQLSVKSQQPFFIKYPKTVATKNIIDITNKVLNYNETIIEEPKFEGFMKKLSNIFLGRKG